MDNAERPWHPAMMTQDAEHIAKEWWYYSVELAPGLTAKGIYPDDLPMLPRLLMRGAGLQGMDCLDLGSMEGLIPTLMKRGGARRVVAADAVDHCVAKMEAVKEAYGVSFDYARVGLMYDLSKKLASAGGFDLINVSGLLYHVFSPMHVIASVRPLLKKSGLMVVSTAVVNRDDYTMEYNAKGRLQSETNTFWYPSIPTMEEFIRYFRMTPIDSLYFRFSEQHPTTRLEGLETGYLSVVCRAVDDDSHSDAWAALSRRQSWEFRALCDRAMMDAQPRSTISYASERSGQMDQPESLNLYSAAQDPMRSVGPACSPSDGHVLRLSDWS